jgi:hypothetical protein
MHRPFSKMFGANIGEVIRFIPRSERERARLVREARARYDSIFPLADPAREQRDKTPVSHRSTTPMPIAATGVSCRDQDHRRALCHLSVPANCHEQKSPSRTSLTSRSVLPDGRAAARRVDEAASGRAPGSMALRHRQTGGSLGCKAAISGHFMNGQTKPASETSDQRNHEWSEPAVR